ncbi:MAG: YIP1 family protein [Chloroflexi bacterium]|nr:YIP1 family protein [Chloroflexota bacterium]
METQPTIQNPWLYIWIRPRGTIRQIVNNNPEQHVIILAVISGIFNALDNAAKKSFGDNMSLIGIIFLSLIVGGIGGVVSLHLGGAVFRWSGSLFGGKAPSDHVRAAIAWSSVPDIVLLIIFIPIMIIFGKDWFTSSEQWIAKNETLALVSISAVAIIGIILVLWKAFLFIKCLAEVHGFSAWKSLIAIVVGFLVILVPIFVLIFGCNALT